MLYSAPSPAKDYHQLKRRGRRMSTRVSPFHEDRWGTEVHLYHPILC